MHQSSPASSAVARRSRRRAPDGRLRGRRYGSRGSDLLSRPGLQTGLRASSASRSGARASASSRRGLALREELMLGEGSYLHAGTVVASPTAAPAGGAAKFPADRVLHHVGAEGQPGRHADAGRADLRRAMLHEGLRVWDRRDARATGEVAHFRCTQHSGDAKRGPGLKMVVMRCGAAAVTRLADDYQTTGPRRLRSRAGLIPSLGRAQSTGSPAYTGARAMDDHATGRFDQGWRELAGPACGRPYVGPRPGEGGRCASSRR